MTLPWLRLLDTAFDLADLVVSWRTSRSKRGRDDEGETAMEPAPRALAETQLTRAVVSALKESFDREARRIEFERERMEEERRRVERMQALELVRQAGERELGRLRLVSAVATAAWIGTLFFSRHVGGAVAPRVCLGVAWTLFVAALAAGFLAQARVVRALARPGVTGPADVSSGVAGAAAQWLVVLGLMLAGVAALL